MVWMAAGLAGAWGADRPVLRLLGEEEPRAFFFRQAEGQAAAQRMSYEQWSRTYGRLMGVIGKVLEEEVPGRSRGLATFVRFKREHPEQAVLLHVNGNSRDPRYEGQRFFAGHWMYYNGATILDAVRAESGETTLRVSNPSLFETGGGRYRNSNDDIGLCELDVHGRPDWARAEQVQLLAIDRAAKTIRVRRGAYGTAPRAFAAGRGYAAAHCSEGPWGRESNLLWHYNYAITAPRDAQGRTAADIYVAHLAELFGAGGALAAFDGLEFDVLFNAPTGVRRPARGPDADADGQRDNGIVGGVNVYGNGVVEFCRKLRAALGESKLILADGAFRRDNQQRATGILNGIESEGWPVLGDFTINDWSGGLNRHEFWRAHARPPVLNYANVKFVEVAGDVPGDTRQASVSFGSVRLAFAGALFTDTAITFAHRPEAPADGGAIWDELVAGQEQRVGWLGRARGAVRRLSEGAADILAGGRPLAAAALSTRLNSDDAVIAVDGSAVRVAAKQRGATEFSVRLTGVRSNGGDLCVTVVARGAGMAGAPGEMARLMHASVFAAGGQEPVGGEIMSWVARETFSSRFYFRTAPAAAELRLKFESAEPVWLEAIHVRAAPDLVAREYERGVVLANPSDRPQSFDLAALFPGRSWRRIRGTPGQDERTNSGEAVGATVVLPARDALFLAAR